VLALLARPLVGPALAAQQTQITGSLDAGVATVTYDDFARSTVGSLAPMLRIERGRVSFSARGAYSAFEGGSHSLEGSIAAGVVSPAKWNVRGEAFATASNTRYSVLHGDAATNVLALGRVHWADPHHGAWVGTGLGAVTSGFNYPDDLLQLDLGAWVRAAEATFTLQALPSRIGKQRFTDLLASARWEPRRAELTASAGFRDGADSTPGVKAWGEAAATYWFTRHLAIVGGAGVFPAELWRGLPGGRYASTALRVATHAPSASDPQRLAELTLPYELGRLRRPAALAERFSVAVEADGTRTLRLLVPRASRVELMADFTDWLPIALRPAGKDRWSFNVFMSPGVHRVNIRVDGGPWMAPPGLTVVHDEFGGAVGLLVVQ